MKRRNADCSKLRRPLKRNRITEGIYGSTFLYLKFLVVWALVLLADFVLEFRFEYLWPFWLFIRSVYDSFRYQGLAFSVFFVCVAFTSDIICLLFIPVQWLFFAASTYVWVQYVWHTERGVCLPTVSLWILFVYIEAAIRFKDLKNFHVDLCRPFAAHCIGYPVVTLGFGFKSYVSYKMRLRKQKEVQKENEFYMQLLQQALPPEQQMLQRQEREAEEAAKGLSEMDSSVLLQHNGGLSSSKKISSTLPEIDFKDKGKDMKRHNLGINNNILQPTDSKVQEIEYMENHINSKRLNNDLGSTENLLKEDPCTTSSKNYKNTTGTANSSPRSHSASNGSIPSSSNKNDKKKCTSKSPSSHKDQLDNCIPNNQLSKPDTLLRLEQDVKKLKADLQGSRQIEQDLRSQIGVLTSTERSIRSEIGQLRQENELLQNKLHNAVQMKQKDKQTISQLEKKLKAEQEARAFVEKQLMEEKKRKKLEEATAARAVAFAAANRYRKNVKEITQPGIKWCTKSGQILQKDQEIKDLKQKIAEVMAVMPSIAYTAGSSTLSPVSPHYSSKFVETGSSGLDPNASVYQPLKK
ncbi:macoilin [Bombina bombina]|uniref:macoilin n=1 Tax=Bombina bombina TaxID=8345 RepID=UPI00235A8223|nr:macoilin [Bombina bombina]